MPSLGTPNDQGLHVCGVTASGCNADPQGISVPPGFLRYLVVGSDRFQVPYIHGLLARDNRIIQKGPQLV